jgi:hypothetical protein
VRAGFDVPVPVRRRVAEKIAALLPLPAFIRLRRGGDDAPTALGGSGGAWMTHAPSFADAISSGWTKGAAGLAALVLAGAGVGVTTAGNKRDEGGTGYRATESRSLDGGHAAARRAATATTGKRRAGDGSRKARRGGAAERDVRDATASGDRSAQPATGGGSAAVPRAGGAAGDGSPAPSPASAPRLRPPKAPPVELPAVTLPDVEETTEPVTGALPDVNVTPPELPVQVPDPAPVVPDLPAPVGETADGLPIP